MSLTSDAISRTWRHPQTIPEGMVVDIRVDRREAGPDRWGNAKQWLGDSDRALNLEPDVNLIALISVRRDFARAGRGEYEGALSDYNRAIGINDHWGQRLAS